jgi:hypothetical protein
MAVTETADSLKRTLQLLCSRSLVWEACTASVLLFHDKLDKLDIFSFPNNSFLRVYAISHVLRDPKNYV